MAGFILVVVDYKSCCQEATHKDTQQEVSSLFAPASVWFTLCLAHASKERDSKGNKDTMKGLTAPALPWSHMIALTEQQVSLNLEYLGRHTAHHEECFGWVA